MDLKICRVDDMITKENYSYIILKFKHERFALSLVEHIKRSNEDSFSLQLIEANHLVSTTQVESAVFHTLRAFKRKKNITRDCGTEFLLRVSGKKQIGTALDSFGVTNTTTHCLLIAIGGEKEKREKELLRQLHNTCVDTDYDKVEHLPIASLPSLKRFYNCDLDLEEIEKKALEMIASIDVLY